MAAAFSAQGFHSTLDAAPTFSMTTRRGPPAIFNGASPRRIEVDAVGFCRDGDERRGLRLAPRRFGLVDVGGAGEPGDRDGADIGDREAVTVRVVLSILDWRCIALPPLKRRCKAGGSWYPRRTYPFDFLYLRLFIFAASAIHGIQPVEGCCHSQSKKWTIAPTAPPSLGAEPIPTSRMV
jgi:hypothetical protein